MLSVGRHGLQGVCRAACISTDKQGIRRAGVVAAGKLKEWPRREKAGLLSHLSIPVAGINFFSPLRTAFLKHGLLGLSQDRTRQATLSFAMHRQAVPSPCQANGRVTVAFNVDLE